MNMQQAGHESLEAFVRTTQDVITENQFDYVLAASDSGQLAAHITGIVYDAINMTPPPAFIAPIFRHVDKERTVIFDNARQVANFSSWHGHDFRNCLFTDDEIWRGNTLNGLLDLVMALSIRIESMTVVAEDGGFVHDDTIRNIPLTYEAPKRRVPEIYNAFSYVIPEEFYRPVYETLMEESVINHKQVMCTLLDMPVKDKLNGMPFFSTRLLGKAATGLSDLAAYQYGFSTWLDKTVQSYMSD